MKKYFSLFLSVMVVICMAFTPCTAFADTAPVPAKLTAPAASIDVSVTAKITMTAAAGASTMDVSDVTVTNNATMGTISLDSVAYGVDVDPWSLTLDTENFSAMAKDQHKFSLTADGQDLKAGNKTYDAKQLTPGASYTVAMEGKTGLSTVEVSDVQAGTVVLTVSMVSAAGSGSGSAEEANPYLSFLGNEDFTLKTYTNVATWDGTLEYSTDTTTWNTWDGTEISSGGDAIYLRGTGNTYITNSGGWYDKRFVFTGTDSLKISCEGNIENLLDYTEVTNGNHPAMADYCYYFMFSECSSLTTAPELPATTLTNGCYENMFDGCTSLVTAPELPATTLTKSCYEYMFYCTSLTAAPELPATTLAERCYYYMFYGCDSLTTAPELPATTLADDCYYSMFFWCTSLTTAPELPATTLTNNCYACMFNGCTSLTTAPELPATTLTNNCYENMFGDCTSLATAPSLPATTLAEDCYNYMFQGCTSLVTLPELPATNLADYCYSDMFSGCSLIKLSTTQTGEYQTAYRIPAFGTGTTATDALADMFYKTGGEFKGTPSINTTYYTSNAVV